MRDAIEQKVRTVVAQILQAPPENIRPETLLLAGVITADKFLGIRRGLERAYGIAFSPDAHLLWQSVGDVILSVETALAGRPAAGEAA